MKTPMEKSAFTSRGRSLFLTLFSKDKRYLLACLLDLM